MSASHSRISLLLASLIIGTRLDAIALVHAQEELSGINGKCDVNGSCPCKAGFGGRNCAFSARALYGHDHRVYMGLRQNPMLFRALDLQGWNFVNDSVYTTLMSKVGAQLVVEVGTWKGASARVLGDWLATSRRGGILICVDTWLGAPEFWPRSSFGAGGRDLMLLNGFPMVYFSFLSNMRHLGLHRNVIPFAASSRMAYEVLKRIMGTLKVELDMVHIDASHEYESVKEDISLWWTLLRRGGVMIGDDYEKVWPGVIQAVDEFTRLNSLELVIAENRKWILWKP